MFNDEFERPALQEVWPILAALAARTVRTRRECIPKPQGASNAACPAWDCFCTPVHYPEGVQTDTSGRRQLLTVWQLVAVRCTGSM
jgi:hypothetical protein